MFVQTAISVVIVLGGYIYKTYLKPPPPLKCGSPDGPPVTSPRIRLSDGRHSAYREAGVQKQEAKYKIVVVHGFDSSKDLRLPASSELVEELKIYFLHYDRPGYGESDPDPNRSVKSEALDIQELADALELGPKFYVIGLSIGAYVAWGCLRYIPERLSGVSLVVPFAHHWWPCFPPSLASAAFKKLPKRDQWVFRVAHYAPWLFYWWMTQKWFPSLSVLSGNAAAVLSPPDLEILKTASEVPADAQGKIRQQGVHESLHRDIMVAYSDWEFSPVDVNNPFPNNDGLVHLWQGCEDRMIPLQLNRFIADKLPWIKYHEVRDGGHLIILDRDICESVLNALLLGHA